MSSQPFADGTRQAPPAKKRDPIITAKLIETIAKWALVITIVIGAAFGVFRCVSMVNEDEARFAKAKQDKENAWFNECLADKKEYECEALWSASQHGRN